ncbi:MAG TPA: hypothetical protein VFL99_02190 [Segeticoccus sp.]|nr:hypothetical protein [Segeticoccus sp.]HET8599107.1 hypothetical protein [Segeticoccus sp.]
MRLSMVNVNTIASLTDAIAARGRVTILPQHRELAGGAVPQPPAVPETT